MATTGAAWYDHSKLIRYSAPVLLQFTNHNWLTLATEILPEDLVTCQFKVTIMHQTSFKETAHILYLIKGWAKNGWKTRNLKVWNLVSINYRFNKLCHGEKCQRSMICNKCKSTFISFKRFWLHLGFVVL